MSLLPLSGFLYIILQDMLLCSWFLSLVWMYMCAHTHREYRGQCQMSTSLTVHISFWENFRWTWSSEVCLVWVNKNPQSPSVSTALEPDYRDDCSTQLWGSNLGLHVCVASTWPNKPPPNPGPHFFKLAFEISPICGHWWFAPLKCWVAFIVKVQPIDPLVYLKGIIGLNISH